MNFLLQLSNSRHFMTCRNQLPEEPKMDPMSHPMTFLMTNPNTYLITVPRTNPMADIMTDPIIVPMTEKKLCQGSMIEAEQLLANYWKCFEQIFTKLINCKLTLTKVNTKFQSKVSANIKYVPDISSLTDRYCLNNLCDGLL